MISRIFFAGFLIVSLMSRSANAEYEIGVSGQSGWSDNFHLGNPDGWGISLSKSLSQKMAIRFTFSRFENNLIHRGSLLFGFLPPEVDRTPESINSNASVNIYELTLHHVLLNGNKMLLEVGGGFGASYFSLDQVGRFTGNTLSASRSPLVLTASINVTVKKLMFSPLALRLGYQYRTMSAIDIITDGFQPKRSETIKRPSCFAGSVVNIFLLYSADSRDFRFPV